MKIRVSDIKPEGSVARLLLPRAWLEELLSEAGSVDFSARQDELVELELRRTGLDVRVKAGGRLNLGANCAACLDEFALPLLLAFDIVVQPAPERSVGMPQEYEIRAEELEQFLYQGDEIDLQELVREQVVLSLPLFPRCSDDCRGLCQRCGVNLNREICGCRTENVDSRWQILKNLSGK